MLEAENLKFLRKSTMAAVLGMTALFFFDGNFKSPADNIHGPDDPQAAVPAPR